MPGGERAWWSLPAEALADRLQSGPGGLATDEAERRLEREGPNELASRPRFSPLRLGLRQFRSPLVLVLVVAAAISAALRENVDAIVVLAVVVGSAALGFFREFGASRALEELQRRVTLHARALRAGILREIPSRDLVPGDVVQLSAGSLVPADGVLLDATDFFVSEAALTGEAFPVEKRPGVSAVDAPIGARLNAVFAGTTVRSGTARALIVHTGRATAFGAIARRLTLRAPETEFDRGLRRFGALLTTVMVVMVIAVFALNVVFQRPVIDSLLFALALAVGLTPELLPAILAVNLAESARDMARHGVLVRKLEAIENFGSMDVLCTDKTGTLSEGVVRLDAAVTAEGERSGEVLALAAVNASLQTGIASPLDDAILAAEPSRTEGVEKVGEVPWDFVRKRVGVIVRQGDTTRMVVKGALEPVLEACAHAGTPESAPTPLDAARLAAIRRRFDDWSEQGFRVLGVAWRDVPPRERWTREEERDLVFAGFLLFFDPPKLGVKPAIAALEAAGVRLKIITGDNLPVTRHLAAAVGLRAERALTGGDLDRLGDDALVPAAAATDLFAEVDPNQKERILLALRKSGNVVGYMGDGINDAPALHAADVSVSVEGAVDVAREAADFVLLERDLDVLRRGIESGRHTFANTRKYVLTTISANFGNMLSMAVASVFLPFLPLLPSQILLNNFLSDVPATALAGDSVDPEMIAAPHRWDMRFIARFMVVFGVVSSGFDAVTFVALLLLFRARPAEFRTAWFMESLLTELAVALVVRTRRPFWRSMPGRGLLVSTALVTLLTLALPWIAGAAPLFELVALPPAVMASILAITLTYVGATEIAKQLFWR